MDDRGKPLGMAGPINADGTRIVIRMLGHEYLRVEGHEKIGIAMADAEAGYSVHVLRRTVPRGLIEIFVALIPVRSGQIIYADEVEW